jgi:chaperonin cofactor prefoldin
VRRLKEGAMTELEEIKEKLDLILDALGLSKQPRRSPEQINELVKTTILKFREKQSKKNAHAKG